MYCSDGAGTNVLQYIDGAPSLQCQPHQCIAVTGAPSLQYIEAGSPIMYCSDGAGTNVLQ